jgi:hypothetical protein
MSFESLIDKINSNYKGLVNKRLSLKSEIEALEKKGVEYGKPSYKNGKYLRLTRSVKGSEREFIYIGNDPIKIKEALDAVDRGCKVKENLETLQEIDKDIINIINHLERATW